jgi:hypothetical protein
MDLTAADLDRISALAEKATPGPWKHVPKEDGKSFMSFAGPNGETIVAGCGCCQSPYGVSEDCGHTFYNPCETDKSNAGLIAACDPDTVRALVAMARRSIELETAEKKRRFSYSRECG